MSLIPIIGQDRLPATRTLLIPGRLAAKQVAVIKKLLGSRPITWLVEEKGELDDATRELLQGGAGAMFSAQETAPAVVGEELRAQVPENGVLVFVPGKMTARLVTPLMIPEATLQVLCRLGWPVLPVAIDVPTEGMMAIEADGDGPEMVLALSEEIPADQVSLPLYQERLLLAHEEAFGQRNLLKKNLGTCLIRGLKRFGQRASLIDGTDDSRTPYGRLLAMAIVLADLIKEETDKPRVAIVLPPGRAGLLANLAVILAGKVPVNLNFTASQESIRSAMRQAGVDRILTVDPFVRKFQSFPWPPYRDLILLERRLPSLKKKIGLWVLWSRLLPSGILARMLGLHRIKPHDEAILLFTSGSVGEPKGVALSHRNVLSNVLQFQARLQLLPPSPILGCLPLFHSFGCTVTLWYPMLAGLSVVTYTSPLETKRLAELVAAHRVKLLLSTPTFLRGFMKRVEPEQLSSLSLVVTGAEKLPASLAEAFAEKFGIEPQEGYGLTETSPAVSVNLPNLTADAGSPVLLSSRSGSVGQLLPGMAVRLTNPITEEPCPLNQSGLIWLRGANVFGGYLNDAKKSSEVLRDGWFFTGDVGRVDAQGFLHIEGRISRFSKIGGEMVPHETLEAAINRVLVLDQETERKVAVVGVPDEQKGEVIVLLSTVAGVALEQECIDLRYKLLDEGIPSLWCPKRIIPVADIPILASGKLDIKGCEALARAQL